MPLIHTFTTNDARRSLLLVRADPHAIERPVDEEGRDHPEAERQNVAEGFALARSERDGEFHRQQSEQRGELDDRVQRHG